MSSVRKTRRWFVIIAFHQSLVYHCSPLWPLLEGTWMSQLSRESWDCSRSNIQATKLAQPFPACPYARVDVFWGWSSENGYREVCLQNTMSAVLNRTACLQENPLRSNLICLKVICLFLSARQPPVVAKDRPEWNSDAQVQWIPGESLQSVSKAVHLVPQVSGPHLGLWTIALWSRTRCAPVRKYTYERLPIVTVSNPKQHTYF